MTQRAQVTSVEAIETFKARLMVYLSQVRPVLDEISQETIQTRLWLQNDQRRFWEHQWRMRYRRLEEAKQELFNATLSKLREKSALQQMEVQRAQQALQEAEAKLALLKRWERELEDRAAPLNKQIEQLHGFLISDMGRAVAYLDQILDILEAYRSVTPAGRSPATGEAGGTTETKHEP